MRIKSFIFNFNNVNTYLLYDDNHEGMLIDCGCSTSEEFNRLRTFITDENIQLKYNICTHLHFDHVFGNQYVYEEYGIKPYANINELDIIDWNLMKSMFMPITTEQKRLLAFKDYLWLNECKTFQISEINFEIIQTPGHSPGGISIYSKEKNIMFSGDVIFENGYGRTDFEDSDEDIFSKTINYLNEFPDDTIIFPGHGNYFQMKSKKHK